VRHDDRLAAEALCATNVVGVGVTVNEMVMGLSVTSAIAFGICDAYDGGASTTTTPSSYVMNMD
jgi:hypothetical protein